ncbi:MAG TPA: IPT/TIG domain-containing protein, partial [Mycobacteriales bacterium]|nr:IPT/TIG domain-containing protein [Mycobacteriales bacterium]
PTKGLNTVTITGRNFTPGSIVNFGTAASAKVTFVSSTSLTAIAPAHVAGIVDVTVTTPGGTSATSSADQYSYDPPPTVTSLAPNTGTTTGGNAVTISGANFLSGATVKFGSKAVPAGQVMFVSTDQLTVVAPAGVPGSVAVTVTTPGGASAASAASLYGYGAPTVSSFTPISSITGKAVTVIGTAFVAGATVSFGTISSAQATVVSGTRLTAVVPNGDVPSTISVTNAQGTGTSAAQFTPTLSITTVSPGSGPAGTVVEIDGVGFSSGSAVKFNGAAATTVTHDSSTVMHATVPIGATSGPITVTNARSPAGTVTSPSSFTVM